jgi:hypothetical protein
VTDLHDESGFGGIGCTFYLICAVIVAVAVLIALGGNIR